MKEKPSQRFRPSFITRLVPLLLAVILLGLLAVIAVTVFATLGFTPGT